MPSLQPKFGEIRSNRVLGIVFFAATLFHHPWILAQQYAAGLIDLCGIPGPQLNRGIYIKRVSALKSDWVDLLVTSMYSYKKWNQKRGKGECDCMNVCMYDAEGWFNNCKPFPTNCAFAPGVGSSRCHRLPIFQRNWFAKQTYVRPHMCTQSFRWLLLGVWVLYFRPFIGKLYKLLNLCEICGSFCSRSFSHFDSFGLFSTRTVRCE